MPIFEVACSCMLDCPAYGQRRETFLRSHADPNPICPECKGATSRLVSSPNVCWAKPLGAYDNKKLLEEQKQLPADGHWAWKKRSSRNADGSPERVWVDSRQKQLEYIKSEGLIDPMDVVAMDGPDSDGMRTSSRGNTGSWI